MSEKDNEDRKMGAPASFVIAKLLVSMIATQAALKYKQSGGPALDAALTGEHNPGRDDYIGRPPF